WTADWYAAQHAPDAGKACCVPENPRGATIEQSYDPRDRVQVPRKVLKGGSHLCAPSYCKRYRPAARHAEQIDTVPRTHTIEVTYDGQDLDWVSAYLGRTPAEVVEMHTAQIWTVAFCGFAPGFGYLVGDPSMSIDVPRLDRPRRSVPAGSVALAGPWSAIYPRASPGGWRLIGHTTAVLWSASAERPALLAPGDVVQFREVHR
ncbi:MAG TPA: carboxyltransferase domain-containing protein, partial [Ilumatobacteraceae bacterium]|nr:carboxyltransferase domain-containing protein [Ilumatobacteraceae bacterium]